MKKIFTKTLLASAVIAICNPAMAGTVSVAKQVHSIEGLTGVTANQRSNDISYTLAADYNEGDKITFTFPAEAVISSSFPSILTSSSTNLSLELLSDDASSATYGVIEQGISDNSIFPNIVKSNDLSVDSTGDAISLRVSYTTAAVLAGSLTVTVSSQTAAGDILDVAGVRTATIAEAKSQFGSGSITSLFDNIIANDDQNDPDGSAFTAAVFDTLSFEINNPSTTGWNNLATVVRSQLTLQGEAGKMAGMTVSDFTDVAFSNTFSTNGTLTFTESAAKLDISYNWTMLTNNTITFTASTAPLLAQKFTMEATYHYSSAGAVDGSKTIASKVNAGAWALLSPAVAPVSPVLLSGSVAFNHHNNTLNGAYCDMDNVLDPGETSMMTVTLANVGSGAVSGITAQVTSSADVTFANEGVIAFTDIASARETMSAALEVTLNTASTNEPIDIIVTFSSDDSDLVLPEPLTTTVKVNLDYENTRATEDFASADSVWLDWQRSQETASEESPSQWNVSNGSIVGPNLAQQNDISLISPTVTVTDSGDFSMAFAHSFEFETGSDLSSWDGGVIEVSVNGGDWTDVITAGGSFTTGYNGTILPSNAALGGRDGFVATQASTSSETITFADGLLNGKTVQFRFRIGSDETAGASGWTIDDVSFSNVTNSTPFSALVADSGVCANRAPLLVDVTGPASAASATVVTLTAQGQDHDADNLNYSWTQTAGTTSINTYTTSATLTFDAPTVEVDESYTFSVVASDAELSSQAQEVSVIVTVPEVEETTETNTPSGGSTGLVTLLLAPLCLLRRRKRG